MGAKQMGCRVKEKWVGRGFEWARGVEILRDGGLDPAKLLQFASNLRENRRSDCSTDQENTVLDDFVP